MGRQTIFSLESIPLPEAVAAHLDSEGSDGSWDDLLLVLPTAETGRRVVEALLARSEGRVIFPPRLATPLSLVPFGVGDGVATPIQSRMAWARALRTSGEFPLTFGEHSTPESRSLLADAFVALTRTLSAGRHDIASAREVLGGKDPRWNEWTDLAQAQQKILSACGLKCPAAAQISAARNFSLPVGVRRVVVAGVLDMPPLGWTALQDLDVTILIHAPGCDEAAAAFASDGSPQGDYWNRFEVPIPDAQISVHGGLDEVAAAAVRLASEDESSVAIICGDAGLANEIVSGLMDAGASGFLPEGQPLARHPVAKLAGMLLRLGVGADWDDVETLLRHPDFLDWLVRDRLWSERHFEWWLGFGKAALRPSLGDIPMLWASLPEDVTARFSGIRPTLDCLSLISQRLGSKNPARELRSLLAEIFGPVDMSRRRGDKEAAKAVVEAIDEVLAFPELGFPDATDLVAILDAISGTWHHEKPSGAVDIEGWLELGGESSSTVILAGLNEGLLPGRRRIDPLLPDSGRGELGLDDVVSREVRDTAILCGAARVLGDRLIVLCGQHSADGTPLKPSRFLLRVRDPMLPARVLDLCRELPSTDGSVAADFAALPLRLPRPHRAASAMSVTDFSRYLACPLRFHLSRRLGMNPPVEVSHRLENDSFGSWIHNILREFGDSEGMRKCTDASEIREFVLTRWDRLFEPYPDDVDLLLQREAGRMRLEEFSTHQAVVRRDGWEIRHVEWSIHGEDGLRLPGWPLALRGRIDRVEVRGGGVRLVDYKTGAIGSGPTTDRLVRSRHLGKSGRRDGVSPEFACFGEEVWTDLQLPLYALALEALAPPDLQGEISLAYFRLPDDAKKAGVFEWTPTGPELASARGCAIGVMGEVERDAVCEWISAGDFQRFARDPAYDDFESLALGRFLDAGALEVVT